MMEKIKKGLLILLLGLIILFPWLFGIYYSNILVGLGITAMFTISWNLMLGYTGMLSIGHATFFGMGAYTAALLATHFEGITMIPTLLASMLVAAMTAAILSPILVRVRATAFAMLTVAISLLAVALCLKMRSFTGGEDGLGGFEIPSLGIPGLFTVDLYDSYNFYYFVLIVIVIGCWTMWHITKTPFGAIMLSIRDNMRRVDYLGFKVFHAKGVVITITAAFAGLSGALFSFFQNAIDANTGFGALMSMNALMGGIIGGLGSFLGPIYGVTFLTVLDTVLDRFTERVYLLNGIIMVLVILFAPTGISGIIEKVKAKYARKEETA